MGSVHSTNLFRRDVEYTPKLGVLSGTFEQHDESSVEQTKIVKSIKLKLNHLERRARRDFKTEKRVTKALKAAAETPVLRGAASASSSSPSSSSSRSSSSPFLSSPPPTTPQVSLSTPVLSQSPLTPTAAGSEQSRLFFKKDGGSTTTRRLFGEDAMFAEGGDRLACVLGPKCGVNYATYITLAEAQGPANTFTRNGSTYAQFMGSVVSTPSAGRDIAVGLLSDGDKKRLIRQGEGITILLDACEEKTVPLPFSDIFLSNVELYDSNPRGAPPRNIASILVGSPANLEAVIEHLISEVDFDVINSLSLVLAFRSFEAESFRNRIRERGRTSPAAEGATEFDAASDESARILEMKTKGKQFAEDLDRAVEFEFLGHFNFTSPEKPIVDLPFWIARMKHELPRLWSGTAGAVAWSSFERKDRQIFVAKKDVVRFFDVVMLIRQSNKDLLVSFANIEAVASEATGDSVASHFLDTKLRLSSSVGHVFQWFQMHAEPAMQKQRLLFGAMPVVEIAYDNHQQLLAHKSNKQTNVIIGTVRYVLEQCVQEWLSGTGLFCSGTNGIRGFYTTVASVLAENHRSCSYVIKAWAPPGAAAGPLYSIVLPCIGWGVVAPMELQAHPAVTYLDQVVLMPLGMVKYSDPGRCRVLDGMPQEGDAVAKMAQGDYLTELRRIDTFLDLRRVAAQASTLCAGEEPTGGQQAVLELLASKRDLLNVGERQREATDQWNKAMSNGRVSAFEMMRNSTYDETTIAGGAKVQVELLEDTGFVKSTVGGKLAPAHLASERRLLVWGDRLTIQHFNAMQKRLMDKLCNEHLADNASVLLNIMKKAVGLPGDLHFLFHMLCAIFRLFFGCFLQVFLFVLKWTGVQYDPVPRFQASRKLAKIVHGEVKRCIIQDWSAAPTFFVSAEWAKAGDNPELFGKEVSLEELGANYSPRVVVLATQASLDAYVVKMHHSDDKVVAFVMEFYVLMQDFNLFDRSVKVGDAIAVELLIVIWIWVFAITGKTHYVSLVGSWIEEALQKLSPAELQELRLNRFIRLHAGKGCIAKDDLCEKMNQWLKKLREAKDDEKFAIKSQFLSWLRRCYVTRRGWFDAEVDVSGAVSPEMTAESKAVYAVLRSASATTELGRTSIPENTFWQHAQKHAMERKSMPGPATKGAAKAIDQLFGPFKSEIEVRQEEEEAEARLLEAPEGEGAAGELAGAGGAEDQQNDDDDDQDGGADAVETGDAPSNMKMRRYPLAKVFLDSAVGTLREKGLRKLDGYAAKRQKELEAAARAKERLLEAVEQHQARASEVTAAVRRLERRMSASAVPSPLPKWLADFNAHKKKKNKNGE